MRSYPQKSIDVVSTLKCVPLPEMYLPPSHMQTSMYIYSHIAIVGVKILALIVATAFQEPSRNCLSRAFLQLLFKGPISQYLNNHRW